MCCYVFIKYRLIFSLTSHVKYGKLSSKWTKMPFQNYEWEHEIMKTRLLSFLLILLLCVGLTVPAMADSVEDFKRKLSESTFGFWDGDFRYYTYDNIKDEIHAYAGTDVDIVIPNRAKGIGRGFDVQDPSRIKSIVIPESVTYIGMLDRFALTRRTAECAKA